MKDLNFEYFENIPFVKDIEYYTSQLMEKRSEIKAFKALVRKRNTEAQKSKSLLYPKADIVLGYKFFDECPDGAGSETRAQLNVSLNIFDGFRKDSDIENAALKVKQAENELIDLESRLKTELKNIYLDFEVSLEKMDVADDSRLEAGENLRITKLGFEKGIMTSTDILDAIYYLSRARFNYLDSRAEVFENYLEISRMVESL